MKSLHLMVIFMLAAVCLMACSLDAAKGPTPTTSVETSQEQSGEPSSTHTEEQDAPEQPPMPAEPTQPEQQEAEPEQAENPPAPGGENQEESVEPQPPVYLFNNYYHWTEDAPDVQDYHEFIDGTCTVCGCSLFIWDDYGDLGTRAYSSCTGDVIIPATIGGATVTEIPIYKLAYSYLTSVTIPACVTSIGQRAFDSSYDLERLVFTDPSGWYSTDEASVWRNKNKAAATKVPEASLSTPEAAAALFTTGAMRALYLFKL